MRGTTKQVGTLKVRQPSASLDWSGSDSSIDSDGNDSGPDSEGEWPQDIGFKVGVVLVFKRGGDFTAGCVVGISETSIQDPLDKCSRPDQRTGVSRDIPSLTWPCKETINGPCQLHPPQPEFAKL